MLKYSQILKLILYLYIHIYNFGDWAQSPIEKLLKYILKVKIIIKFNIKNDGGYH